jgi:outer membrane protein assembly factor BamB
MGQVYLGAADDGVVVAIKVVHPGLADDDRFRERFRREVEVSRKVTGPWVAAVVDADPEAERPWLATQYVPGRTLQQAISDSGPFPPEQVRTLALGLASALGAIHDAGVVHRDLKPSNVLLDGDRPRLIDFGISRAVDGTRMTSTGVVIGTPAFMSPEQISGEDVGPASDVFSMGSVLYFAATGQGPFGEVTPVVLMLRISREEPVLDGVPEFLRGPIGACLAKKPENRPAAADLATLLERYRPGAMQPTVIGPTAGSDGPTAPAVSAHPVPATQGPKPRRRLTRRAWLGVAGATCLTAAAGVALIVADDNPGTATPPPSPEPPPSPPVVDALDMAEPGRWRAILRGNPTPDVAEAVADEDMVYLYSDPVGVVGMDAATGDQRWALTQLAGSTSPTPTTNVTVAGNMTLADGVLAVGTGTAVATIDPRTGTLFWLIPRSMTPDRRLPLAIADGVVVTVHNVEGLVAQDLHTGEGIWRVPISGKDAESVTVAANNQTCFLGYRNTFYALELRTGIQRWSHSIPAGTRAVEIVGDLVLACSFDEVIGFEAATGAGRWITPTRIYGSTYDTSVGLAGDVLVLLEGDGNAPVVVRALNASDGVERWSVSDPAWAARARVACTDGIAYVAPPEGPVSALDTATGARIWTGEPERSGIKSVTAHGRDVYLNCWGTGFQAITVP